MEPTNEKLMEILRRCHVALGEALIDNSLDEDAASLHDELGELLGIPAAKRTASAAPRSGLQVAVASQGSAGKTPILPTSAPSAAKRDATSTSKTLISARSMVASCAATVQRRNGTNEKPGNESNGTKGRRGREQSRDFLFVHVAHRDGRELDRGQRDGRDEVEHAEENETVEPKA